MTEQNQKKSFKEEWKELPMRQKAVSSFALIWPVVYLGFYALTGCGGLDEAYVKAVDKYSKPVIKDYKRQINDNWNPIYFQREKVEGDPEKGPYTGKPNFDKPVSQAAKDITRNTRNRQAENLDRTRQKGLDRISGKAQK